MSALCEEDAARLEVLRGALASADVESGIAADLAAAAQKAAAKKAAIEGKLNAELHAIQMRDEAFAAAEREKAEAVKAKATAQREIDAYTARVEAAAAAFGEALIAAEDAARTLANATNVRPRDALNARATAENTIGGPRSAAMPLPIEVYRAALRRAHKGMCPPFGAQGNVLYAMLRESHDWSSGARGECLSRADNRPAK